MTPNSEAPDETKLVPDLYYDKTNLHMTVNNPEARYLHENGFFGNWISENTLSLAPEEILLLLDRGRIEIFDATSGQRITSSELVTHFLNEMVDFWPRYLVYKDLRSRGYVVRIGTRVTAPFRIYSRGGKPGESVSNITVFPLAEGNYLDLDFLDQIVSQARIDRKKLLLSVIDRLGDVTYYTASQLELERNEMEYEYRDEGVDITPDLPKRRE
ncbi:MAG: tRNA-intron lyase [Candidatus Thorarchaeota archaeon]